MVARRMLLDLRRPVVFVASVLLALALRSTLAAVEPQDQLSFDPALVTKGAQLAAIGNCGVCHTKPGGKSYAGGLPMPTPFGTIYSTNITPDRETGIGKWSEDDFRRAMHDGVGRDGRQLYPAFPYDHFTKVSNEDINAIYAFVMTRNAVRAETPPNKLRFPINFRPMVKVWKVLFFKKGVFQSDPSRSEQWNRGAYLVEGVGHCGACHTPRNALGAEKRGQDLAGGEVEGWHAPALNSASPAPVPWTATYVFNYLRYGWDDLHGVAVGPMAPVVHNLAQVPEPDMRAIATYVASMAGEQMPEAQSKLEQAVEFAKRRSRNVTSTGTTGNASEAQRSEASADNGAAIFAGACASCHTPGGMTLLPTPVELALSTAITAPDSRNLVHIILKGIWPDPGEKRSMMPGFAGALTDAQVIALVVYLRAQFSDRPAWRDVPQEVHKIAQRKEAS